MIISKEDIKNKIYAFSDLEGKARNNNNKEDCIKFIQLINYYKELLKENCYV